MLSLLTYDSQRYMPFVWRNILTNVFQAENCVQVLCYQRQFILPKHLSMQVPLWLITPAQAYLVEWQRISYHQHQFLTDCQLQLCSVPINAHLEYHSSTAYFTLCVRICQQLQAFLLTLYHYVHDHLQARDVGGVALTQHQVIQARFASCYAQIKMTEILLQEGDDIRELFQFASTAIAIINELAKLSGGRAILRENAVECLFHLTLFRHLFLNVRTK